MIVYTFDENGLYTGTADIPGPGWPPLSTPTSPLPIPSGTYAQWDFLGKWNYVPGTAPTFPTPWQIAQNNKAQASTLLYETDWTTIPDVANPVNNPYLGNQAAFLAYRNALRKIAISPTANDVFPTKPKEEWIWK